MGRPVVQAPVGIRDEPEDWSHILCIPKLNPQSLCKKKRTPINFIITIFNWNIWCPGYTSIDLKCLNKFRFRYRVKSAAIKFLKFFSERQSTKESNETYLSQFIHSHSRTTWTSLYGIVCSQRNLL